MKTYLLIIAIAVIGIAGLYWAGTVLLTENLEVVDVLGPETNADLTRTNAELLVGKPAPEFELPIVGRGYTTQTVADTTETVAESYVFQGRILDGGKPMLIIFWASWHQGSADQLKILSDYGSRTSIVGSPTSIVTVALQEDKNRVRDFLRSEGRTLSDLSDGQGRTLFLADETGEAGELYNVRTLPTTYFIDGQGIVRDIFAGVLNKEMLEEKINKLIVK